MYSSIVNAEQDEAHVGGSAACSGAADTLLMKPTSYTTCFCAAMLEYDMYIDGSSRVCLYLSIILCVAVLFM